MLKTLGRFVILFILQTIGAQVQLKPKPLEGIEGRNITVTCSFPENTTDILLYVGGRLITGIGSKFLGLTVGRTAVEYGYGPLEASDDGVVFECDNTAGSTDSATLRLLVPPEYSVNPSLSTTVLEGTSEYSYQFTFVGYPVPTNFTWRRGSEEISNSARITITVNSITIRNVQRSDSGTYIVTAYSAAGMGTANFTLDVQYPPEFTGVDSVGSVQLRNRNTFTFNCTPSDANPSSVNYSFRRNGTIHSVSGSVLTISSVVRGDSGNYSCTATNSAGSTTVYYGLLVVAPPTEPQTVTVSQVTPFSSTISWTSPTDDGGISSPSWIPPSPYSSTSLTYHVTHSNSSGIWTSTGNSTQSVLAYLQHSTDYTVSVVAENVYGRSTPSGEVMFGTNDSKPIIDRIALMALSLTNFTVNITFLTVGGETVTSFKIMVNGTMKTDATQVTDGKLKTVSLVVDGLSLTKGTDYSVSVTATNSIGESEPVMGTLTVPNPPSITSPPTELPPNSTSPCCSGVKLNLARPVDLSDISVTLGVNGGPSEMARGGDLNLTGDILYISGLQAGTDYTGTVTISNIFGSTMQQITLKPLLGRPSNPAVPAITVDGTEVTVVLNTDYPGTERTRSGSRLTFQVHFNENGRSTRQSVLDSVDVSPLSLNGVSTDYRGVLEPGSYTLSVTAVNEHGSSSSVMSEQFLVQAAVTRDNTTVIIGAVAGVVVFILLILIVIFICFICYKKFWRTTNKGNKEDCTYNEMQMNSDVLRNIQLDANPSYQPMTIEPSVNDPTYEEMETKLQLTANPAYEPIGLAQTSEQNPLYSNL